MKNHLPSLINECSQKLGKDLRQKDIAEAIGMQEATLSRYVNGHMNGTKFDIEAKLCVYFSKTLGRRVGRGDIFSFEFDPS